MIADMGCGTGLVVEQLLERVALHGHTARPITLTAVDLVPEALERTRHKWEQALRKYSCLQAHRLECAQMDLTPNRLLPVRAFLTNPSLPLGYLRNRVEGLTAEILAMLDRGSYPKLRNLLSGESISPHARLRLESRFSPETCEAVIDFNMVVRFLQGKLVCGDLNTAAGADPMRPLEKEQYQTLRTSDLRLKRLRFGSSGLDPHLGFPSEHFDKIIASLFLSYLHNPDDLLREFFRMLKPGGLILVSSMKPDSDISTIFMSYVKQVQGSDDLELEGDNRDKNLNAAREVLNEAAGLFELEEDGFFRFYTAEELQQLVVSVGFVQPQTAASMGSPPQAVIVTARKPQ